MARFSRPKLADVFGQTRLPFYPTWQSSRPTSFALQSTIGWIRERDTASTTFATWCYFNSEANPPYGLHASPAPHYQCSPLFDNIFVPSTAISTPSKYSQACEQASGVAPACIGKYHRNQQLVNDGVYYRISLDYHGLFR
jgi:hypothetical protein